MTSEIICNLQHLVEKYGNLPFELRDNKNGCNYEDVSLFADTAAAYESVLSLCSGLRENSKGAPGTHLCRCDGQGLHQGAFSIYRACRGAMQGGPRFNYTRMLEEKLPEYEVTSVVVSDCDLGGYTTRKRAIVIGSRIEHPIIPQLKMLPHKTVEDALKKVDNTWPNAADITKSNNLVKKKISMIPEGGK